MPAKKDSRLTKAGVSGFNKPKRTPSHPTKSHIVVAKQGDQIKTIRFGQQGVVATMLIDVKDEILNLHHKIDHVDEQVDKVDDQMHDHMMWHYKKSSENKSKVKGV